MAMILPGVINHPIPKFLRNLHGDPFSPDHPPEVLYRASHSGSAGSTTAHEITCGSYFQPATLDQNFLHQWVYDTPPQHFDNHFDRYSMIPTMFISTTPEFLRALHLADQFKWEGKQDIKITIIDVAAALRTDHDLTNAGKIARKLKRSGRVMKGTEWLFLGCIKEVAIVHQINFDHRLYSSMCTYFPSFAAPSTLESLRNRVREDFRIRDQWLFDGSDPAADDGRRCAFVANNFGLDLPNQNHVYAGLVKEMWNWKGPFIPTTDEERRFEEKVSCWAIDREEP